MEEHEHDHDQPYDVEPDTDDHEAVEAYAAEVTAAVKAFDVQVRFPSTRKPPPQDMIRIPGKGTIR